MSSIQNGLMPITIKSPLPLPEPNIEKCETQLNIGLFFDGTDNNKNDGEKSKTNIARLWNIYRDDSAQGFFRYYVSGVGTPFAELERKKAEALGGPYGRGGDSRIHYGLLQVVNSVHRFLKQNVSLYEIEQLDALCSETTIPSDYPEVGLSNLKYAILNKLGLESGLDACIEYAKKKFFADIENKMLELKEKSSKKISGIYLDVFGFSRGAMQARVFCNWLHEYLLKDGRLFGIPAYVRILGLFETVSSVGKFLSIGHGHNQWASAANLQIHPKIKNCYHIIALHELRMCFPLDSVADPSGKIPANCQEVFLPGAHSDIGGGYLPGEQGKIIYPEKTPAEKDDRYRLAALPLNLMLEAAQKSCAGHTAPPWLDLISRQSTQLNFHEIFSLGQLEKIRQEVADYFQHAQAPQKFSSLAEALRAHNLQYLAWRYAASFEQLKSVQNTTDAKDLKFYKAGEEIFRKQIQWLSQPDSSLNESGEKVKIQTTYHSQADAIFAEMKNSKTHAKVGDFFDNWVHDSFAGFINKFDKVAGWNWKLADNVSHSIAESQGYIRWRGLYAGNDKDLNHDNLRAKENTAVAEKSAAQTYAAV